MNKFCKKIQIELSAYIDNEHTNISRNIIKEHLEKCISCKKVYDDINNSISLVKNSEVLQTKIKKEKPISFSFNLFFIPTSITICIILYLIYTDLFISIPISKETIAYQETKKTAPFSFKLKRSKKVSGFSGNSMSLTLPQKKSFIKNENFNELSKTISFKALSSKKNIPLDIENQLKKDQLIIFCKNKVKTENDIKQKFSKIFSIINKNKIIYISCDKNTFKKIFPIKNIQKGNEKIIIQFKK